MYWLVGSLIVVIMMGVLATAETTTVPVSSLLGLDAALMMLPFLLILIAACLYWLLARGQQKASRARFGRDTLLIGTMLLLIVGSGWQALNHHAKREQSRIQAPIRVQALVTIKGISDSVYDTNMNSGYRQVAVLSHITPLISKQTAQDLDQHTLAQHMAQTADGVTDHTYRVLLNAYPKSNQASDSEPGDPWSALNQLQPNEQRLMTLALKPLSNAQVVHDNQSGFDSYRWLRGRGLDGTADILAFATTTKQLPNRATLTVIQRLRVKIDQWRWQLRQHFYQDWTQKTAAEQQAVAVTLSLLTGDRSLISRETKDLYQLAGISHLLAISGTHVLFLAILLAGAAVLLCNKRCPQLYRYIPRWQLRWWVMVSAALIYALFTGFDVPAARTAWMLIAIGLVRLTLLPISTMRVLIALAVMMAWLDPYVLWQAGYWLSFVAVALLLKYDTAYESQPAVSRPPQQPITASESLSATTIMARLGAIFWRVVKLQCWLFIALLPITLLLFGKVSLWGLVVNIFAIGLFGWVIVPLNLLAGLLYIVLPAAADMVWLLVSALVAALHKLLISLTATTSMDGAWLYTPVTTGLLLIAFLALLPWLIPRGVISRWLTVPPLALLMMSVYAKQQHTALTPTLYILPTGDRQLSAALLQYPIDDETENTAQADKVSWLFLTDHRLKASRRTPSHLTALQLSKTLIQQLRTLSTDQLDGIVVQSSIPSRMTHNSKNAQKKSPQYHRDLMLPVTAMYISQHLPTHKYWQAGDYERLAEVSVANTPSTAIITPQPCEQGKRWQLDNQALSVQAVTGWRQIDDAKVWDCALSIDSDQPIQVVRYDASKPLQPAPIAYQVSTVDNESEEKGQSRLLLDVATHEYGWQLWSLLCDADPSLIGAPHTIGQTTWLSHSQSAVPATILRQYDVNKVGTYDDKPLAGAQTVSLPP